MQGCASGAMLPVLITLLSRMLSGPQTHHSTASKTQTAENVNIIYQISVVETRTDY